MVILVCTTSDPTFPPRLTQAEAADLAAWERRTLRPPVPRRMWNDRDIRAIGLGLQNGRGDRLGVGLYSSVGSSE